MMKVGDRIFDLVEKRFGIIKEIMKTGLKYSDMNGGLYYANHGEYQKPKRRAGEKQEQYEGLL